MRTSTSSRSRPLAIDYNQRPHAFTAVAAPVADYGEAGMDGVAPV